MGKPKPDELLQIHVKFPRSLVEQLDALAKKLEAASPGLTVTRTDVLKMAAHAYLGQKS